MKIAIDGNIGVGKTTLIKNLKETLGAKIYKEKIDKDLLEKFYKHQGTKASEKFELFNQLHFMNTTIQREVLSYEDEAPYQIYDRSLATHLHIFSKLTLSPANYVLYSGYQELIRKVYDFERYDLQIILTCATNENMTRIHTRGREVEKDIPVSYINSLEDAHRSKDYRNICEELYTDKLVYLDVTNLTAHEVLEEVTMIIKSHSLTGSQVDKMVNEGK